MLCIPQDQNVPKQTLNLDFACVFKWQMLNSRWSLKGTAEEKSALNSVLTSRDPGWNYVFSRWAVLGISSKNLPKINKY